MKNKARKGTLIGSIIASIVASACCIGPIVFALLGISSTGLLSKLEVYRPLASAVTLLLLGSAFYFTYRKKPVNECEKESYCAKQESDKWNKRILWLSAVFIFIFLTFPYWSIYLL